MPRGSARAAPSRAPHRSISQPPRKAVPLQPRLPIASTEFQRPRFSCAPVQALSKGPATRMCRLRSGRARSLGALAPAGCRPLSQPERVHTAHGCRAQRRVRLAGTGLPGPHLGHKVHEHALAQGVHAVARCVPAQPCAVSWLRTAAPPTRLCRPTSAQPGNACGMVRKWGGT